MASGRRRRFKLGYDGWGADFIGLLVVLVVVLWGIHKWNAATKHPLGLPDIPLPGFVKKFPAPVQRWLSGTVLSSTLKPETPPSSPSVIIATPAPIGSTAPSPEPSSAAPTPLPSATSPTPVPSAPADSSDPAADAPPVMAVLKMLKTSVRTSPNPLMASATALCQNQDLLCLGLADGGIAIREKKGGKGIVVPLPSPAGPVRSVALSRDGGRVWWLANNNLVYSYDRKNKALRSVELPAGGTAEAISFLPGTEGGTVVVLGGETAARFFDGNTGRMREASEVLPIEAADAVHQSATSLYCAEDLPGATQASVLIVSGNNVAPGQPAHITLWSTPNTSKPDAWASQEMDINTAPAYSTLRIKDVGRAAVDVNASGAALLARPAGGETLAACQLWTSAGNTIDLHPSGTLPKGVFGLWAAPDRIATGKSGLWWTFGGSVFHAKSAETAEEKSEVYLPWNLSGKGGDKVTALLADDSGVWVATGAGVRRITPAKASTAEGYGGYVRARLGEAAGKTPSAPLPQKLAKTTQEWEGTPYKWGGDDKKGVDCSGYVSAVYKGLGVSLPRSTAELPTCSGGPRIRDELKYGDVLVFPGHCAVYMGNGWTSEAMTDSGVGKATIWTRKQVVVRRFLRS